MRKGWEDRVFREVAGPREPDASFPPPFKSNVRRELETLWMPEGERELYEVNDTLFIPAGGYVETFGSMYFRQLDNASFWPQKTFKSLSSASERMANELFGEGLARTGMSPINGLSANSGASLDEFGPWNGLNRRKQCGRKWRKWLYI